MPRPPRLHVPGGCYHVVLRGNHCEALFGSSDDRRILNSIVADALDRCAARVHAFCWMTNHLHALVQIADQPLGKVVQRIAMRYARHRHRALRTSGHLFERRHKARLVDFDAYFLTVLRYIHLNPVKAQIVADPSDYPWSSHRAYLGVESIAWLTCDLGLSLFAAELHQARMAYQQFVLRPEADGDEDLGEQSHPEDFRILGTDRFISSIPRVPYRPRGALTLQQLAEQVCARHNVGIDLLRSPSRTRQLTPVRMELVQQAIEQRIATLSGVARYLGRDSSALTRLLARHAPQGHTRP